MKLLLVTSVFPSPLQPSRGAFNHEMVRALAPSHEVKVVAPVAWPIAYRARRQGRSWDRTRHLDGVQVTHPVYFYTPRVLRRGYGAFFSWSIRRAVTEMLRDFEPDLVLGYWTHPDGQAAVSIARRLGVPAVVMVGGSDVLLLGRQAIRGRLIRQVLEDADAIVTVSNDLKQTLSGWALPASKLHVVYRGVDTTRFSPAPRTDARHRLGIDRGRRMVVCVGHLVPVKGLDVLLQACATAATRADFHVYLVGDGPLRATLQRRCVELAIKERVTFVGAVDHAALPDWYRAADVTVLSSRSEGIPNVLLESMACGTPFVAPRIGGIPEIADPAADRLVAPADPNALAAAIVDALTSGGRIERRLKPPSTGDAAQQLLGVLTSTMTSTRRAASNGDEPAIHAGTRDSVRAQP